MKRDPNEKRSFEEDPENPRDGDVVTPLSLERAMLARVAKHAGPAGFPRVHHFGRQRVFGRESRVLVMDLLGPSLEEMSWAVSAGGPLSRLTTLMIADQALARLAAVHRAGVVHRDVKPDNLLLGHPARGVGANRALHLVDFGLAALGPSLHGVDDASVDERGSEGSSRKTSGDENSATTPRNLDEPLGVTNEETNEDVSKIKETPVVLGTPAFSAAAADAGRPPTYADDLEALVFTVAYLRAGTFPWCPPSLRGDVAAVAARKAGATAADLATRDADREWMGALLAHARADGVRRAVRPGAVPRDRAPRVRESLGREAHAGHPVRLGTGGGHGRARGEEVISAASDGDAFSFLLFHHAAVAAAPSFFCFSWRLPKAESTRGPRLGGASCVRVPRPSRCRPSFVLSPGREPWGGGTSRTRRWRRTTL